MSRLIFEGDTISRFGKKIPTPFIEKLKIYNDVIVPTISIYLHITEDDAINQEIYNDLSNLYLHSGFMRIANTENLNLGNTFLLASDQIYNSQGKRFAKFSYSPEQAYGDVNVGGSTITRLTRAITRTFKRETYYSCFISVLQDEDGELNSSLFDKYDLSGEIGEIDEIGSYARFSNVSSPLVYEKVFTAPLNGVGDNRLANDPINLYEDSAGLPYESIPLQSIQKDYYKTSDSFREDLKKQIDDLVAPYGTTEDQQLQSFLDSISYVSETQSRSAEFIVELDKVRNSFPSRTSTSALGILYNRLKTIIFSANDALILGERLQKKIVPNTKLASYIGIEEENREASWTQRSDATLYSPRPDDTGKFLYSKFFMERQELEVDKFSTVTGQVFDSGQIVEPNYDVVRNFGYFFLDYEKAIQKKSNISQIYPVQKLLNLFGNNSLDGYFQISKTELLRFNSDKDIVQQIASTYQDNLTLRSVASAVGRNPRQVVFKEDPDIERNYVVLRKFDTARGLDGYRLLAFEYQDFQPSSTATKAGQSYRFNIEIEDKTIDFYDVLKSHFKNQISKLLYYLELAREFCSYNNIDGRFNDFFVEGVKERFRAVSYPWVSSALIYAIHLDLIEDAFQGNFQLIKNYADFFSDSYLNPQTTTLEILENKVALIVEFYEKYYGDDGIITREVDELPSPDGVPTGRNLRDNIELVFTNGYDKFPDIVDFTPDSPDPIFEIKRWNGSFAPFGKNRAKEFIFQRIVDLCVFAAQHSYSGSDPSLSTGVSFSDFKKAMNKDLKEINGKDFKRKERNRAQKMYAVIQLVIGRVVYDFGDALSYSEDYNLQWSARRDAIKHQMNKIGEPFSVTDPQAYKDLRNETRRSFEYQEFRSFFGNLILYCMQSEYIDYVDDETGRTWDPWKWIEDKFDFMEQLDYDDPVDNANEETGQ